MFCSNNQFHSRLRDTCHQASQNTLQTLIKVPVCPLCWMELCFTDAQRNEGGNSGHRWGRGEERVHICPFVPAQRQHWFIPAEFIIHKFMLLNCCLVAPTSLLLLYNSYSMELRILGDIPSNRREEHVILNTTERKKRLQSSTAAESEQKFPLCALLWNNQQHAKCQAALFLKYDHQESDIIWAARYMILL